MTIIASNGELRYQTTRLVLQLFDAVPGWCARLSTDAFIRIQFLLHDQEHQVALSGEIKRTGPRPRIEGLSDLIFGLALSIGALSLLSKPPSTAGEVGSDIVGFAFSFLILISVWMSYTRVMSVLPLETGTTMLLNVLMLFLVAIEPYLFYLVTQFGHLSEYRVVDYASTLYAFDMGGLMAILAFFNHELSEEEKALVSQELLPRHRRVRDVLFLSAGLFFITALPQFWVWEIDDTPVRFYLWFGPLAITWISRGLRGFKD